MTNFNTTAQSITEHMAYQMEEVEKNAWADMYHAAPGDYAQQMGIVRHVEGTATLISAVLPVGLFNKAFMHGLTGELTQQQVQAIKTFFAKHNAANYYVYVTPFTKPANAAQLLEQNGLKIVNATDKVYCEPQNVTLPPAGHSAITIKPVTAANAEAWADFICATYGGLPNQPWLHALVGRKGWHHLVAEKDGQIIACRTMYIDDSNRAWLGIDAPIPGLMTNNYEPDALICRRFVEMAKENNVTLINSCVEHLDDTRNTEAYQYYYNLSFKLAYRRNNYGLA